MWSLFIWKISNSPDILISTQEYGKRIQVYMFGRVQCTYQTGSNKKYIALSKIFS